MNKYDSIKPLTELLKHFDRTSVRIYEESDTEESVFLGTVSDCIEYMRDYCEEEGCTIDGIADWQVLRDNLYVTVDMSYIIPF